MQKKDDKVGNKTANKEERQRKKSVRERKIEIDSLPSPQKRPNFCLCECVKNTKNCLMKSDLSENMPFFAKLVFSRSSAY